MSLWHTSSGRWMTVKDAVTGNQLSFNIDHIAVVRELRGRTSIVLPSGLAYEVEAAYTEIMHTIYGESTPTTQEPRP